MRKYHIIIIILITQNFVLDAQNVGINATGAAPDTTAILDISSAGLPANNQKGILIPRVELIQKSIDTPIVAPTNSLLIYNTANINDVYPGYYYWDSVQWVRIINDNDTVVHTTNNKVINVTYHINSTRRVLLNAVSITMESFTVNKVSPTSILVIDGTISGWGTYSGSTQQGWKYGSGTEVLAQSVMYSTGSYAKVYPTKAIIIGHTTVGPQSLVFRYFTAGSPTAKPFNIYNPNVTEYWDLGQTSSVYIVYEIEP